MGPTEARRRLADRQADLVRALSGQAAAPPGFDTERLAIAARALLAKRRRSVAKAWPLLTESLGERFGADFAKYARSQPLPRDLGPLADGRAFATWLVEHSQLPEEAGVEVRAADLRYRRGPDGLQRRRWPCLRLALLRRPRRVWLGLWLPWLGSRWWTFRLPADFGRRSQTP
jgi:hypothetical protein